MGGVLANETLAGNTLGAFASSLGMEHLEAVLSDIDLSSPMAKLESDGRVALLSMLKEAGVAKLPERQKLANALSKASKSDISSAIQMQKQADERQVKQLPPGKGLRVLFLHGYGLSPGLIKLIDALGGVSSLLPGAHIEVLPGFEKIDFAHEPTAAAFADPANALKTVRDFSETQNETLYAWANFVSPNDQDAADIIKRGYAREGASVMSAVAKKLLEHIDQDPGGGYDWIVGFSQGGEYGMLVASLLSSGRYHVVKGGRMPRKFLLVGSELGVVLDNFDKGNVAVGGGKGDGSGGDGSTESVSPPLTFRAAEDASATPLEPSAVVVVAGAKDPDAYSGLDSWAEQLREKGLRNLTTATWGGDHRMPPKGEAVYDLAMKQLLP